MTRTEKARRAVAKAIEAYEGNALRASLAEHAKRRWTLFRAADRLYDSLRWVEDPAERDRIERETQAAVRGALAGAAEHREGFLRARADRMRAASVPSRALSVEERQWADELKISRGR